ncbi:MAG TPA: carboxypeptidase-like regulatory domain-containing protein [Puia sp.]|nr:carboxypeptidase-like regulatory domain-containing protein [Puia sp.]
MLNRLIVITMMLLPILTNAQPTGTIKGRIIEQATKQPIPGVTVAVKDRPLTVLTDSTGAYSIPDIPPGTYSLILTHIGFQERQVNDISVVGSKTFYVETELLNDNRNMKEVTVKAFRGEQNLRIPVSSYSFSREEIFRSPGAQGDIFRAIGILPGVVSSGGQYSAIAVRGQGTSENVYMADDIPLFEVSHLEIEGFNAGFNDPNGGRFSIFAPRVIDNALFEGGGFSAQYGRRSSSYLGLGIKEGNKKPHSSAVSSICWALP